MTVRHPLMEWSTPLRRLLMAAPERMLAPAMASTLAEHLTVGDVLLDLAAASRDDLFAAVGQHMAHTYGVSADGVAHGLRRRERIGSSALGHGVAIPCARVQDAERMYVLFIRLAAPIPFDAPDGLPVSELLVLLVPKQATEKHLHLFAEATQLFADQRLRQRLRLCCDATQVAQLLREGAHRGCANLA
ncbi:PTS sugar transporter subunit IIA [Rhodocyclus gracilis]|nr:PTS sugar transporter subunit IIA [Rhodocyclus gracilis]